MKILIIGGHLSPAFALIEEFENEKNVEIVFVGRKYSTEGRSSISAEANVAKEKNVHFRYITTGRLQRKFTKHTIPSLLKIPLGIFQSFIILLQEKPDLVVSFGSYVSTPIVLASAALGISVISHEQASVPGLATKINYFFSKKVFLTWKKSKKYFISKKKLEVTGNLVRSSFLQKSSASEKHLKDFLEKDSGSLIFITGGNQGSHFLNNLVFENSSFFSEYQVIHQIGLANYGNDHLKAKEIKNSNYFNTQYLQSADFATVLKAAKLVIARAGANTTWELILAKKPSILIPLPISASGEQKENARILEEAGFAIVLTQGETTAAKVPIAVKKILLNYQKFTQNAEAFEKTLPKNARQRLKDYILKYTKS